MTKTRDVIVIGGGIIGACCAYQLAKKGANVTLLEKRHFGSGASGSSAAMLECQTHAYRGDVFLSIARPSLALFADLHKEIKEATGIDFEYEACGILNLAMSEEEAIFLKMCVRDQAKNGFHAEWLSAEQVAEKFPVIEPDYIGAALYHDDGQVNGEKFLQAVLEAARRRGATLHENTGTIVLKRDGGRTTAASADNFFQADSYVVAAGAWSDEVLAALPFSTGISPIRGQLAYYDTPPSYLKSPIFTLEQGYIVPKRSGYSLIGTTVEKCGFDESTTDQARDELVKKGRRLVPGLSRRSMRGTSAGLRPKPPGDHPIIGPIPTNPNVFVASGHYRNGMLLAPITAEIIAALVCEERPPVDIRPFAPAA